MITAPLEKPQTETDAADLALLAKSVGANPNDEPADAATEETTSAKPTSSPVATLWLPEVKSSRAVVVYGGSGKKYIFQANAATQNRPARHYYDSNTFEREEADIRKNRRAVVSVCTLLGKADMTARAGESVQGLIDATKIPAGMRKAALRQVLAIAQAGLAGLDHIADPVAGTVAPAPPVPRVPDAPLPAASSSSAPSSPSEPSTAEPDKTWLPKEAYSEAQLSNIPLEELRALAAHYNVPGNFRREIIRAWAKKG